MKEICRDLADEQSALKAVLTDLSDEQWQTPTPFYRWTVKDQITHLAWFDRAASLSIQDPDAFQNQARTLMASVANFDEAHQTINATGAPLSSAELLAWWSHESSRLLKAFSSVSPKERLPWYGRDLGARSSATARLMETWAHGQDIVDAFGLKRPATHRLKHIAHLGAGTLGWSFLVRGFEMPKENIFVRLTSPTGEPWCWGDETASQSVSGPAEAFCLVVTQRRHVDDTDLDVKGEPARRRMECAQAFAGTAENGPKPGERKIP